MKKNILLAALFLVFSYPLKSDVTGINPVAEEDMFWAYVEILGFLQQCVNCSIRFFCPACKQNKLCQRCSIKPLCKKCSKKIGMH